MDTLVAENILVLENGSSEDRLRFRHLLFQEAAYQSLLIRSRQHYHEQIAELLLTRDAELSERHPELVAHHLSRTEQVTRAVDLWIRAGRLSMEKSAFVESIDHQHQGLALVRSRLVGSESEKQELALLLQLGVSLTARAGYYGYEVTRTYERAVELAEQVGDGREQWTALYGLWRCLISQAEYARAMRIGTRLNARSRLLDDPMLELTASGIRGMTRLVDGKLARADDLATASVALYQKVKEKRAGLHFGQDPYVTIQGLGAVAQLLRGDIGTSFNSICRSLETARRIGHPYTIAETLKLASMYEQIARNIDRLRAFCLEAVKASELHGFEGVLATHRVFLAFADLVQNRDPDQLDIIRDNLLVYEQKYGLLFLPYFQSILVEGLIAMECHEEAFHESEQILGAIDDNGEEWVRPTILFMKSQAAMRGKLATTKECRGWYLESLEVARRQGARLTLGRALVTHAEYGVDEKAVSRHYALFGDGERSLDAMQLDYISRLH